LLAVQLLHQVLANRLLLFHPLHGDIVNTNIALQLKLWYLPSIQILRYKTDELVAVLKNNNIDICFVTKSCLTDIPTQAVDINGSMCYRQNQADGRQVGGVIFNFRQDLLTSEYTDTEIFKRNIK